MIDVWEELIETHLSISDIEDACLNQKESIAKAVQKAKAEYTTEAHFAVATDSFIKSVQFKSIREKLGIKG